MILEIVSDSEERIRGRGPCLRMYFRRSRGAFSPVSPFLVFRRDSPALSGDNMMS